MAATSNCRSTRRTGRARAVGASLRGARFENNFRRRNRMEASALRHSAGWSAPQPPTPHPSGDRPWPLLAPGSSLWAVVENGNGNGTRVRRLRLNALARYPIRAGVGAGLADLSLRDETRRVPFSISRRNLPRAEIDA